MEKQIKSFIEFYRMSEKLKTTMRHSWTSNPTRQESVAEHSWGLALLALVLSDELGKKVNLLKVLKMVAIHDLAEAITGDIPAQEVSVRNRRENKLKAENKALKILGKKLPKKKANEVLALWEEIEENKTTEAKFVQSLDKLEVVMQHNFCDISKWDQSDFDIVPYYKDHLFDFNPFIRTFKNIVDQQTMKRLVDTKTHHRAKPEHLEKYKKSKKSK